MSVVCINISPLMSRIKTALYTFPPPLYHRHRHHMLSTSTSSPATSKTSPSPPRPTVLILTGPTSVGKSSTALSFCLNNAPAEIISADSVQLYRNLTIGCNKPSPSDLSLIPHHLLDVASPSDDEYSAGDFHREAKSATRDVISRNALPVIVGGTMMYVRWFIHGRPATPATADDARQRTKILLDECKGDWEQALQVLKERDLKRAGEINKNDWYRLTRAIEIWETTGGRGVTDLPLVGAAPGAAERHRRIEEGECVDEGREEEEEEEKEERERERNEFDFRCVFLYMSDRVAMNRKIDLRCEHMILPESTDTSKEQEQYEGNEWRSIQSIFTEVTNLLVSSQLAVTPKSPCLAIGYRQTITYLLSTALSLILLKTSSHDPIPDPKPGLQTFGTYIEEFQQATRNYAKQQIAWFRKDPLFHWVPVGEGSVDIIKHLVSLPEEGYRTWFEEGAEEQRDVKVNMMEQGKKGMRTYISKRDWLTKGSEAEKRAVQLANRCSKLIAERIEIDEIERMLQVVKR